MILAEVELTHLRLEKTFEGSVSLDAGGGEVRSIFDGRGPQHEVEAEHLSQIIEVINERFGLKLTEADQLLFNQFEETWIADPTLAAQAKQNTLANFRLAFDRTFMNTIVGRMDANDEIFKRILDDKDFRDLLADYYVSKVYGRLRQPSDLPEPPDETSGMWGQFGEITPNEQLRRHHLPSRDDDQLTWIRFALTFDGYEENGGTDKCDKRAMKVRARWESTGSLPSNLSDLRTALFAEQRGWRWGHEGSFTDDEWRYWHALVDAMRELLPV